MSITKDQIKQDMLAFKSILEKQVQKLNVRMQHSNLMSQEAKRHGTDRSLIELQVQEVAEEYYFIENSIEQLRCDITELTTAVNSFKTEIQDLYYNIESSKRNILNFQEDKKCLKIMAYNVNGLKTKKNSDLKKAFYQFVKNKADIFILIETHVKQNESYEYSHIFDEFNISWQYGTQTSGRASGGILCGVRKTLISYGLHHEFKSYHDKNYIVVKINNFVFTIIPVYIRQSNWEVEFQLYEALLNHSVTKNPILMGDFNVRIGQDQQNCLKQVFYAVRKERKSQDYTSEINSEFFLKFLKKYQLTLLNGRTMGDTDGKSTKSNSNVCTGSKSVIDYCCVHSDILAFVNNFVVEDTVRQFSDHLPIILELTLNSRIIAAAGRS